jgi:hypothetical protein
MHFLQKGYEAGEIRQKCKPSIRVPYVLRVFRDASGTGCNLIRFTAVKNGVVSFLTEHICHRHLLESVPTPIKKAVQNIFISPEHCRPGVANPNDLAGHFGNAS